MKLPKSDAIIGYTLTAFFMADFLVLAFVSLNIIVRAILGVVLILGAVKFYLGSKNIKSIEFNASPFKLKITYFQG